MSFARGRTFKFGELPHFSPKIVRISTGLSQLFRDHPLPRNHAVTFAHSGLTPRHLPLHEAKCHIATKLPVQIRRLMSQFR